MKTIRLSLLFAALMFTFSALAADKPAAPKSFCTAPQYHQFDFWIGDWDTFDVNDPHKVIARNNVQRILGGCVLRENYQQSDGLRGQSFNIYDSGRKIWRQSWVTNHGQSLQLEGTQQANGDIVLDAVDHENGGKVLIRGTWKRVDGGVRETAVKSKDNGKTWTPWFDVIFRPHHASNSSAR